MNKEIYFDTFKCWGCQKEMLGIEAEKQHFICGSCGQALFNYTEEILIPAGEVGTETAPSQPEVEAMKHGWCPECEVVVDEAHIKNHADISAKSADNLTSFEAAKELPKLRELARMVTESPCFTNAILAVTDAYREGWRARGKS